MAPLGIMNRQIGSAQPSPSAPPDLKPQDSVPTLRISGDALRKLIAEGTSGKTWPRMQSEASGRPPLPFKKKPPSPKAADLANLQRQTRFANPEGRSGGDEVS